MPNCNDCLSIKDVETRKKMYLEAINWYLHNTPYDIVFCENSGTDISIYLQNDNRLEILTFFASNNPDKDQSKSSREMDIIKYAYEHSSKIVPGALFVKITGRLKYLNLVDTVDYIKRHINRNLDMEFVSCELGKTNIWSDSRCFFFTYKFFQRMFAKQSLINISFEFERLLGTCVYQMLKNHEGVFWYLPLPQRISGVGGGIGTKYDITDAQYRNNVRKHNIIKHLFNMKLLPLFRKSHILEYGSK